MSKTNIYYLLGIMVISTILYSYVFDSKFDLNGDNIEYYLLGKSISEGHGYSASWNNYRPYAHRPPGYSIITSIPFLLGFESPIPLKILNFLLFLGTLFFFYKAIRNLTENDWVARVSVFLLAVNPHMLQYSSIIMSEIPSLFFSILAFYYLTKTNFQGSLKTNYSFWISLIVIAFGYHIRSMGITLIIALVAYLMLNKNWKYLGASIGGFFLLLLPFKIRNLMFGVGSGYIDVIGYKNPYRKELGRMEFFDYFERMFNNLLRYIQIEIPNALTPFTQSSGKYWMIGLLLLALSAFAIYHLEKLKSLFLILFLSTFGILLLWPEQWFGIRFFITILPYMLFLTVFAVFKLVSFKPINKVYIVSICALLAFFNTSKYKNLNLKSSRSYPAGYSNYFKMGEWVKKNTPENSLLIARKPSFFNLFSERQTVRYAMTNNHEKLIEDLEKRRANYIVVDQLGFNSTGRYLVPAIQKNPKRFKFLKLFDNPKTYLFEFVKKDKKHEN